jgi:mono/diheme cytochrome c family protein
MRPPRRLTIALATLLAACGRDAPDVREPLGARNPGASGPARAVLAAHAGRQAVVPPTASLPPATYTAEQAARGAQVYQATCVRCHPPGQLDGGAFAIGWNEARAWTLFSTLRNTMPQDKPGSLTDEQYVDVIAYLLQRNRVPAGAVALRADSAALRGVRIAVSPAAPAAPASP